MAPGNDDIAVEDVGLGPGLHYSVRNAVRALEVLAFAPVTSSMLGDHLGISQRTARRFLVTLAHEEYAVRDGGRGHRAHVHRPTVRLLALAAQLHRRLPLVQAGELAVGRMHADTGGPVYLASPAYREVLVLASAGEHAPPSWTLLPATKSAAGHMLLTARERWGSALEQEPLMAAVKELGYARFPPGIRRHQPTWVAVEVPPSRHREELPDAALATRLPDRTDDLQEAELVGALRTCASRLRAQLDGDPPVNYEHA